MQAAIATIESKVLALCKALATIAHSWEYAQERYQRGQQMLMLMADGVALGKLGAELVREFRTAYP